MKKKNISAMILAICLLIILILFAFTTGSNGVLDSVAKVNGKINGWVWTAMLFGILGTGVLVCCGTGWFQFRHWHHWWKESIGSVFTKKEVRKSEDEQSISQFQSLCTALSATVGTGNIVGVATAIVLGGPGSIFWMWLAAILGLMTNYSENVLGIYYRRRNKNGEWSGGAMYYLHDGLGGRKHCRKLGAVLAGLFSVFAILASFGIGNLSQINGITDNVETTLNQFGVESHTILGMDSIRFTVGLILCAACAFVIVGGLNRIASVTEKLVPFMAIFYIVGSLVLIFNDHTLIGPAFAAIFRFAFTGKAVAGGTIGTVIRWGLKRGVFSNEAGLGSSVMVHSNSNAKEPVTQGIWGIFEVFADTLIICTLTAMAILTSGQVDLSTGKMVDETVSATSLTSLCFADVFGRAGSLFVTIALIMFAYSTVLGWSHYGKKAWEYMFGEESTILYRVLFIVCIFLGAQMTSSLAWDISDTFNGLMALPNLIGVITCAGTVFRITRNYERRVFHGEKIRPMLSGLEDIQKEQEKDYDF